MKNILNVVIAGMAMASIGAAAPERSKPAGNPNHAAPWSKELDAFDAGYRDEKPIWADPELDTSDWSPMLLPCNWEDAGYPELDGFMWFRRTVTVEEAWAGKDLTLGLCAINDGDRVWFNGKRIGEDQPMKDAADPRQYTIPGDCVKAGENVLVIRVYDLGNKGGISGKATDMWLKPVGGGGRIALSGSWLCKPGLDLNEWPR